MPTITTDDGVKLYCEDTGDKGDGSGDCRAQCTNDKQCGNGPLDGSCSIEGRCHEPGIVFLICSLLLVVISMIPLLLGLFVSLPILVLTNYTMYRDIFVDEKHALQSFEN